MRKLIGREQFWPIAAPIAAGLAASHPMFAGNPLCLALAAGAGYGI